MSLQIWYPFNGTLNNQGVYNDENITISGTPNWDDNGKIGKCKSGGIEIKTAKNPMGLEGTIAFWIYVPSTYTNTGIIFGNNSIQAGANNRKWSLFLYPNRNSLHSWGCMLDDNSSSGNGSFTVNNIIPDETWTHIAISHDNTNQYVYVNGILNQTIKWNYLTGTLTFDAETQIIYQNLGVLYNDFRIYDECLSIKQIKELSKGLVAHYKLSKHVDDTLTPDDSDYHALGYDSNIERDVSGNGYDLEYSTIEPEVDNNSALNKNSFKFTQGLESTNSGQQYLSRPYFNFLTDNFTFSCWVNQSNRTSYSSGTEKPLQFILSQGRDYDTYGFNIVINNGRVNIYVGDSTDKAIIGSSELSLFTWHLVTCTYDGSIVKLYIDGVLANQQSVTSIDYKYASDRFVIGKMSYSYTYSDRFFPFVGNISDVRIYSTALSDNDIKDLYELRASLDKDGNYYTNNIMEE